tara:strand:+ start:1726 stop:3393 length:1668 start_codon:yes stop_codon:yes gene_type:complete
MARQYDETVGNVFDPYDDVPREVRGAGRIRQSGLQRLLAQLPQAALEIAENIGGNIQARNELDFRKEQAKKADEKYKQEIDYRNRQLAFNEKKYEEGLVFDALETPDQKINFLLNRTKANPEDANYDLASLTDLKNTKTEFNDDLEGIYRDVNIYSSPKKIAINQLKINDFFEKYADNPYFKSDSPAYTKLLGIKAQLDKRASQMPYGFLSPEDYADINPLSGEEDSAAVKQYIKDRSQALSDIQQYKEGGSTPSALLEKAARARLKDIEDKLFNIRKNYRVNTLESLQEQRIKDKNPQDSDLSNTFMAEDQSRSRFDFFTSITDEEMADVSNQISTLTEVEDNLNKINEGIPGIGSDETDLAETESTTEIEGGTSVLPDVLRTTQLGAGSNVVDKVDSGQFDAEGMLSGANNQKTKTQEEIDSEFLESQGLLDRETGDSLKSVSEIKRLKHRNIPAAFADDLGRGRNTLVKKLFNLMDEYDKTDPSKNSRRLNKLSLSMNQLSDKISTKLKGFINPKTGNFSDANYTAKFYNRLSDVTGVSVEKLKDTIKSIVS